MKVYNMEDSCLGQLCNFAKPAKKGIRLMSWSGNIEYNDLIFAHSVSESKLDIAVHSGSKISA